MHRRSISYLGLALLGCGLVSAAGCSDEEDDATCTGADCAGATSTGGTTSVGGKSGTAGKGGTTSTGGTVSKGGTTSTGGTTTVGGAAVGGATSTGGTVATGGAALVGGAAGSPTATGGAALVGGAAGSPTATGGAVGVAGAAGNRAATGGAVAVGGSAGSPATTAGSTSVAGTTSVAGSTSVSNGGTAGTAAGVAGNTSAGTSSNTNGGTAGAAAYQKANLNVAGVAGVLQGSNLAQGVTWWGDGTAAGAGNLPRLFVTSTQSKTANTPSNIVDNARGTFWVNGSLPSATVPEVFGIQFTAPVTISVITIRSRINNNFAYNPSDFTIETSDTGAAGSWTVQAQLTRDDVWPIATSTTNWVEPLRSRVSSNPIVAALPTPVTAQWLRFVVTRAYCKTELSTDSCNSMQVEELEIR